LIKKHGPNYRWYILALTGLTYALITGASRMCMPVLFKQIEDDLGLSVVAIGTIWGMDPLAGVFIGLPGGLLADRFGVKRTLVVVCILAGVFGALRGLSVNFFTMALTMFLFGLNVAAMPSIVPKVTTLWFSGKQLALTNGLLNVAWSVGAMIATQFSATVFSPWLGSWRYVLFMFGIPGVLVGILWYVTGREPDKSERPDTRASEVPFREALSRVIRIKDVWLLGIMTMTIWGASMGFIGYLPLYLRDIGWTPTAADSTITVLNGVGMVGVIPMVLLANKLSLKGVLAVSIVALALSVALLPFVNSLGVWVLIGVGGFLRSGASALFNVMVFETKGVGTAYAGTAIGLASTISMLGAFLAPPIGNSLASIDPGTPMVFWGCLAAVALPLLIMVRPKSEREPGYA
jgi:predicted MFS family arabinose efflux permease